MCDEIIELVAFDTLILPTASYSTVGCRKGQEGTQGAPRNGSICTLTMQTTGGLFVTFNMKGEMILELLFKHYYFLVSHVIVSY